MGIEVEREQFTAADFAQFSQRLREDLKGLRTLLARPGAGMAPPSIGIEVEMHLVDEDAQPACISKQVQQHTQDPRCTLEIDAFNFELNTRPTPLSGRPFEWLEQELHELLAKIRSAASESGARVLLAGTLPTLTVEQLRGPVLSDSARYRAMSRALRDKRGEPFVVNISGQEQLHAECDDLTLEGANASLQVHLLVSPADFPSIYNMRRSWPSDRCSRRPPTHPSSMRNACGRRRASRSSNKPRTCVQTSRHACACPPGSASVTASSTTRCFFSSRTQRCSSRSCR